MRDIAFFMDKFRIHLLEKAEENKKTSDLIAILYIIYFISILMLVPMLLKKVGIIELSNYFVELFDILKGVLRGDISYETQNKLIMMTDKLMKFTNEYISDFSLYIKWTISVFIFMLISQVIRVVFKSIKVRLIVQSVLSFVYLIMLEENMIFALIIGLVILFWMTRYISVGSLKYVNFFMYLSGAIRIYHLNKAEEKARVIKSRFSYWLVILISFFVVTYCTKMIFWGISLKMNALISLSLFLLIWMNSSSNKVIELVRKLVVYVLFIPIVILANDVFNSSDVVKMLSIFITVFFSLERIIGIGKEIKKQVEEYDINYIFNFYEMKDYRAIQNVDILNELDLEIEEEELVKQVLCYMAIDKNIAKKLIEFYLKNFYKYEALVLYCQYQLKIEKYNEREIGKTQLRDLLSVMQRVQKANSKEQNIIKMEDAAKELADLYFQLGENELEIINLLSGYVMLSDYYKFILVNSYVKVDNIVKAEEVFCTINDKDTYSLEI
ncbi:MULTISPECIES: hypothetical protein [Bacillus cereus group]|uniref:Uncharacterized protein n=5 Tax=Bacillaceae TaxID=186817 RepID=A0A9X7GFY3_BACTU|nr:MULTISPECIES: hypothetical protein [Bacillus cereus group]AHA70903.1 hypothetical protein YBT1518_08525 [Bacillus thuringiensis YBT-1518]MBG9486293.1 hypothetical protein [Bacillus thuringiensis]MBG9511993.1 hypothetical protein [Bacillus thuringiensis]MED2750809.1 hypothetical protein [Bacillus thuringiensis]MED2757203.1 hypothetical protein [Bacillus thuringiensis]